MTKEQEEAIKECEALKKCLIIYSEDLDNVKSGKALETVLNMLKEKDTEIEKKDKMIDLMAEQLIGLPVNKIKQDFEKPNFKAEITIFTDKEDIKQYFERKATNNS